VGLPGPSENAEPNRAKERPTTVTFIFQDSPRSKKQKFGEPFTSQKFASQKFDWIDALLFDWRRRTMRGFLVGYCIAQHINQYTRDTKFPLSDQAIGEEIGCHRVKVCQERNRLRRLGWLIWRRRPNGNIYSLRFDNVAAFLAMRTAQRAARRAAWNAPRQPSDVTPALHRDVPPALHKHLEDTSEERLANEERVRGVRVKNGAMGPFMRVVGGRS
jgi:hypothetical protein